MTTLAKHQKDAIRFATQVEKHGISMVEYAIKCGAELIAVKEKIPYGSFEDWCADNMPVNKVQYCMYMRVSEHVSLKSTVDRTFEIKGKTIEGIDIERAEEEQIKKDERKKASAERARQRQKVIDAEIAEHDEESIKLYNYYKELTAPRNLSDRDLDKLVALTSAEAIWRDGYQECYDALTLLFSQMSDVREDEPESEPEPESEKERPKPEGGWWRPSGDDQFKDAIRDILNSAHQAGPGGVLIEVLTEAGPVLQKKVFKLMKQHLHPDRDTGNEALFVKLTEVEETFK